MNKSTPSGPRSVCSLDSADLHLIDPSRWCIMLDPRSAGRPRSRSTSMLSLRPPHITVEVDNVGNAQSATSSTFEPARHQMWDLLPTRSLPAPTIHIMDSNPISSGHPADGVSDEIRHFHPPCSYDSPNVASIKLRPDAGVHRIFSMQQGVGLSSRHSAKREERLRTPSAPSACRKMPDEAKENEPQQSCHHHIPDLRHQSSAALSARSAAPLDFHDLSAIYMVVASRRDSYDNLLWQCPTLALTAQSFLFSIALDGETTRVARIIAMLLSIVITTCSLQLFTRQLAAEQADRQWLISFERRHGVPFEDTAFGENWDRYASKLPESAGFVKVLALTGSFPLWRNSLFVFLGAAVTVLAISFIEPSLFEGGDSKRGVGG